MKHNIQQFRLRSSQSVAHRYRQALVGAAYLALFASSLPAANTWYVNSAAGPCIFGETGLPFCPYLTVSRAVIGISTQVSPVQPGDTVVIATGIYPEPIVLGKPLRIQAEGGPVTIGPRSLWPLDVVAQGVDDNGLPLNPKWGSQVNSGALPDPEACKNNNYPPSNSACTHQPTDYDLGNSASALTCYLAGHGGHVNWFGCTYRGTVVWDGHSCPACDDDYQMNLQPENSAGLTINNAGVIECEFDSDETIDKFQLANLPWWQTFKGAVDADGCAGCEDLVPGFGDQGPYPHGHYATQMMGGTNGVFAIVSGLMGLDCGHSCQSELHPVYALAMNVQPSIADDLWVFFVRNWGDEGFCSSDQHYLGLPNDTYTFRLPWKPGATSVSVTSQAFYPYHNQNPPPVVTSVAGQGVFVTFKLDPPRQDGSMWDGELHLQWHGL